MLTNAQLKQYWEKGWLVAEGVFTRAEAQALAQFAWEISNDQVQKAVDKNYLVDKGADGSAQPRKIERPFLLNERFRRVALDPRLTELARQLLKGEPLLCTDQIFMKPPRFGSAKPYHQDNFYFKCEPADQVLTAWIAMDDVDEANGCLRYIDGSHLGPILPHTAVPGEAHNLAPAPELIDLKNEALALVKAGGVVFHHGKTLHTSHRNESDRWRRAYATHWVTPNVTCTSSTLDNAHYKSDIYRELTAAAK